MQSRICNSELNYRNKRVLELNDIRIKKTDSICDVEYAYKINGLHSLFDWLMRKSKYNQSASKTVDISSIDIYQEIHKDITIIFCKMSINASNYIKNLIGRKDLVSYFRAKGNSLMLFSKSTSKKNNDYKEDRIMAYAEPLLKLARTLYDGNIYFNAANGLKVNYYSLNPKELNESLQIARDASNNLDLELEDIDIEKNTIHEDISPTYSAYNGQKVLVLTFCILRGINGYEPSMGKTLIFPDITEGHTLEMMPQDDNDDYFDICIFLADVVKHGSSIWNKNHPKVLEQFNKVRNRHINNEPWQPARMSITMPIHFNTNNPKQLWYDIQSKLKQLKHSYC